ncbi:MAG: DUF3810 domain-containing protein [Peptococcaceae bacterium]|nr:DUF3810 domain-containing protein [Peptococcaceae bacterium]
MLFSGPLAYFLGQYTAFYPEQVERYYALGFAQKVTRYLSLATGVLPFSLAELLVCLLILGVLGGLAWSVSLLIRNRSGLLSCLKNLLFNLIIVCSLVYLSFQLIWGLNYNRLSFAEIADLELTEVSEKELMLLCTELVEKANGFRDGLPEDQAGILKIEEGFAELREKARQAFLLASSDYHQLSGNYGLAKPVSFSRLMSYTGITGIYIPFTGEANVNIDIPAYTLPATICHEMAHQRGFAREDECNYIAWLVCNSIEDRVFQYSGTILALNHSLNALWRVNPQNAAQLRDGLGAGVKRDLAYLTQYWSKYEGKIEQIASDINDSYLKSNRQQDGIQSYGRMVALLLAEQKKYRSLSTGS